MTKLYNWFERRKIRKTLRNDMPNAEKAVWSRLRGRQLQGKKFRRQYGVGPYTVDFYCPELKLAIEIDGDSHFNPEAEKHDRLRQCFLEGKGIVIIRFANTDVYQNIDGVIEQVLRKVESLSSRPPFIPPC